MKKILIFIVILIGNLSLHCEEPCPPDHMWGKFGTEGYRPATCYHKKEVWKL